MDDLLVLLIRPFVSAFGIWWTMIKIIINRLNAAHTSWATNEAQIKRIDFVDGFAMAYTNIYIFFSDGNYEIYCLNGVSKSIIQIKRIKWVFIAWKNEEIKKKKECFIRKQNFKWLLMIEMSHKIICWPVWSVCVCVCHFLFKIFDFNIKSECM